MQLERKLPPFCIVYCSSERRARNEPWQRQKEEGERQKRGSKRPRKIGKSETHSKKKETHRETGKIIYPTIYKHRESASVLGPFTASSLWPFKAVACDLGVCYSSSSAVR